MHIKASIVQLTHSKSNSYTHDISIDRKIKWAILKKPTFAATAELRTPQKTSSAQNADRVFIRLRKRPNLKQTKSHAQIAETLIIKARNSARHAAHPLFQISLL